MESSRLDGAAGDGAKAGTVAGAAWNIGSLIAFRVVQGIGGGLLVPVLTTLLVQAAGGRPLGKLMATVSLPAVLVPILGPVAGGLIVGNLSWRWIFSGCARLPGRPA
jgi:MFS family permease